MLNKKINLNFTEMYLKKRSRSAAQPIKGVA
ncbi:MAG: hypothetical protein JWR03_2336 [Cohnella sp.]|nr:hypothetical protein [Cohnella sp.]